MEHPERTKSIGGRVTLGVLSLILAVGLLGLPVIAGANSTLVGASPSQYNNVQVLVHPSGNFSGTYVFSAYNSSGSVVAWSQTGYPAASFELPSGTYLLTVNAFQQDYYACYGYPVQGAATSSGYGTAVGLGAPAKAGLMPPCRASAPKSEYGYALQSISSSTTVSINTVSSTQFSTSKLSVKVEFANGTAASDVSVSSYVVGGWNWWGGNGKDLVMYAQTGRDGVANLEVPAFPVEVYAWKSIPVTLPKNQTTVQTTVAGEKVNVTVYWQPMYVNFVSSALVMPPQDKAKMTLHYQPQNYWPVAYGAEATGVPAPVAGAVPGPNGGSTIPQPPAQGKLGYGGPLPATIPPQGVIQISPLPASGQAAANSGSANTSILLVALAGVGLASVSLALTVGRRIATPKSP